MNSNRPHEAVEALLPPDLDGIAAELKDVPRWVAWKLIKRDGKLTKMPIAPLTGHAASSTDAATWASFDEAVARYRRDKLAGIGFVLGDGFAGIDLDDCRDLDTGALTPLAEYVIGKLDSYAEVSPSGTGVKLIVRGAMSRANVDHHIGFEGYSRSRFFTFTGHRLPNAPLTINERQTELDKLIAELFPKANSPKEPPSSALSDREVALSALNALSAERADQYSGWLAVGMALHAVDASLLSDWDAWSRSSGKYRDGNCSTKWASFNGRGLGLGSLIHWARNDSPGWQPPRASITSTSKAESEGSAIKLESMPLRKLLADFTDLQPPVIHGLLRLGETANIIAAPKLGKSFLTLDLVLSVATGSPWLDTFDTVAGPVLLIDNELHPATLANRLRAVAEARRIRLADVADLVQVIPLRGRLRDLWALERELQGIPPGRFRLIVLDAFYRFLPAGTDENDNAAMTQLYNCMDRIGDRLGSANVLIHHASKGNQSGRGITDVGSGAGAQSRAVDAHIVLRPHEDDGAVVLDAAVRSWPPVAPVGLRWEFPVFQVDPSLDTTQLRRESGRRGKGDPKKSGASALDSKSFAGKFLTEKPESRDSIIGRVRDAGFSATQAKSSLALAESDGLAHRHKLDKFGRIGFASVPQRQEHHQGGIWPIESPS